MTDGETAAPGNAGARWIWGLGRGGRTEAEIQASRAWLRLVLHFVTIAFVLYWFIPA
ncbi:MAG TPA: hypothetical protein VMV21_04435 [Vicinamibacteria bacterium]|nr:hypothetical protein [Vicinamibacteria bacterium]